MTINTAHSMGRMRKAPALRSFAIRAAGVLLAFLFLAALAPAANTNYVSNRAPLANTPYVPLPLGSVKASGWLLKQLELQRDGLTGHAENVYRGNHSYLADLTSSNGWLGGSGDNWERAVYYVRGLIDLAYTLDDATLKTRAQKWIDWTLNNQQANGNIGPASLDGWDWWPRMPMLNALTDYYDATGDSRVTNVLEKYFQYQSANVPGDLWIWGTARAVDNILPVFWLYNRTGNSFLLNHADTVRTLSTDWSTQFNNNSFPNSHAVNVAEGYKFPAVWYQKTLSENDRKAYTNGHRNIMNAHGQPHQLPAGTEDLCGKSSLQGYELCTAVERIWSDGLSQMIFGDPSIGDNMEKVAFNALPGILSKSSRQLQYYALPNQAQAKWGKKGFAADHSNNLLPGWLPGWPCCCFDWHMGWPKFTMYSWAATEDNGLAVMAYAPTEVTATVANGVTVKFVEETQYPFEEQIRLTFLAGQSVAFPLKLRIPGWCVNPTVKVNGTPQGNVAAGTYLTVNRTWVNGDTVTIDLPMSIKSVGQINNSVSIERGPLVYSLKIGESWNARNVYTVDGLDFGEYEIIPTTSWNYALGLDPDNLNASFTVRTNAMPANPFEQATTPITLTARAKKVASWTMAANDLPNEVPTSPAATSGVQEVVTLVPFGAENLRITYFPHYLAPVSYAPVGTNFTAYNDCAWIEGADTEGNFTQHGPVGSLGGHLIDTNATLLSAQVAFNVGTATGVNLVNQGFALPAGSDAELWLAGRIGTNCAANWSGGSVEMRLSGLDTGRTYNIVLWATRGFSSGAYSNRFTDITLSGADEFVNLSSPGTEVSSVQAANDRTRVRSSIAPGYVARYDGVRTGTDGDVLITLTAGNDLLWPAAASAPNGYLNAFAVMTSTNQSSTNAPPVQTNAPVATWNAFNDMGWISGEPSTGLTVLSPAGTAAGVLMDSVAATSLAVNVAFGGAASFYPNPANLTGGTPAQQVFDGKVGLDGYVNWGSGVVTMTLSNLDPARQYSFILFGSRGLTNYTNRWTDIRITGADGFINNSSPGSALSTVSQPNDETRISAANTEGRIWRYDAIQPGSDGTVIFTATAGGSTSTGGYLNAFMLQPWSGAAVVVPDSWKLANFASTNVDLNADADGDGLSNRQEYIAATGPNDGSSCPRIVAGRTQGGLVSFDLQAATQRIYRIEYRTNLTSGSWQPYATVTGAGTTLVVTNAGPEGMRYYRFRVSVE